MRQYVCHNIRATTHRMVPPIYPAQLVRVVPVQLQPAGSGRQVGVGVGVAVGVATGVGDGGGGGGVGVGVGAPDSQRVWPPITTAGHSALHVQAAAGGVMKGSAVGSSNAVYARQRLGGFPVRSLRGRRMIRMLR